MRNVLKEVSVGESLMALVREFQRAGAATENVLSTQVLNLDGGNRRLASADQRAQAGLWWCRLSGRLKEARLWRHLKIIVRSLNRICTSCSAVDTQL